MKPKSDIIGLAALLAASRLLIALLILLATLTACRCNTVLPDTDSALRSETAGDGLIVLPARVDTRFLDGEYIVYVTLSHRSRYTHIVQEIFLDSGETLVECFRADSHEIVYDRHSWSARKHSRRMRVYAADVEGAHESPDGFAHLPENADGSVKTTVGKGFNADHQASYETRGRIVRTGQDWLEWTVMSDGHSLRVDTPETVSVFALRSAFRQPMESK